MLSKIGILVQASMIHELSQKYHFVQFQRLVGNFYRKRDTRCQIFAAQDSFNPDFGAFDSAPSSGGEG